MDVLLAFFEAMWGLMWFPLMHLEFGYVLVACPFLLLLLALVFGSVMNVIRRF